MSKSSVLEAPSPRGAHWEAACRAACCPGGGAGPPHVPGWFAHWSGDPGLFDEIRHRMFQAERLESALEHVSVSQGCLVCAEKTQGQLSGWRKARLSSWKRSIRTFSIAPQSSLLRVKPRKVAFSYQLSRVQSDGWGRIKNTYLIKVIGSEVILPDVRKMKGIVFIAR